MDTQNQPTNQLVNPNPSIKEEAQAMQNKPASPAQTPQVPSKGFDLVIANLKQSFSKMPQSTKRILIGIGVGFFVLLIILSALASIIRNSKKTVTLASPTPISVSPTPQVIIGVSHYATDSGVIKIEGDLNNIQNQMGSVDVKQTDLSLPNLDFNINFNQ